MAGRAPRWNFILSALVLGTMLSVSDGAYLNADEQRRVVSDLNAGIATVSARDMTAWLIAVPRELYGSAPPVRQDGAQY